MASRATAQAPVEAGASDQTRVIVVAGLAVGVLLGFGGNFLEEGSLQNLFYAISALGLIVASVLLAVEHVAVGDRFLSAGFVLLALGETRVLNPTDVPGGEASFAAGVLLYAPALLLIALSRWAPTWARVTGAAAAVVFAVHSLIYLGGGAVDSAGPLAGAGYALLSLTIIGWVATVIRARPR